MPTDAELRSLSETRSRNAKASGVVDQLLVGDRKSAISILLGQELPEAPEDWRVRVSAAPQSTYLYKDGTNALMAPLQATNGVVFPYTPRVTLSYTANYDTNQPTHSNYPVHTYKNSGVAAIGITGDFTAQNPKEARYMLAAMMFFRASTKMFWGKEDNAGQPPPVLYLNGYGTHFLPNVPIVITSYASDMPDDVDYVEAYVQEAQQAGVFSFNSPERIKTRLPSAMTMTIQCEPVYSRKKVHDEFTFTEFAKGNLIGGPSGAGKLGGGGFI